MNQKILEIFVDTNTGGLLISSPLPSRKLIIAALLKMAESLNEQEDVPSLVTPSGGIIK